MPKIIYSLFLVITLFTTNQLFAEQNRQTGDMQDMIKQLQAKLKENPNMSRAERKALIQKLLNESGMGQKILYRQKEQMPKLIRLLKQNRTCLSKADNKDDVIKCEMNSRTLAKQLGIKENFGKTEEEKDFV